MVLKIIIILDILLQGNTKIPPSRPSNANSNSYRILNSYRSRYDREQCASTKNRSIIHTRIMKENTLHGHSIPYSYLTNPRRSSTNLRRKSNAHNGTVGKFREDHTHTRTRVKPEVD